MLPFRRFSKQFKTQVEIHRAAHELRPDLRHALVQVHLRDHTLAVQQRSAEDADPAALDHLDL